MLNVGPAFVESILCIIQFRLRSFHVFSARVSTLGNALMRSANMHFY